MQLAEIAHELGRLNQRTGDLFSSTLPLIRLDDQQRWAEICLEISTSGWHAWEAAAVYIETSPDLKDLILRGDYGLSLCGFSFEPSITYFRGLQAEAVSAAELAVIEETGDRLKSEFPHASSLLTEYFRSAFVVVAGHDRDNLDSWCSLVRHLLPVGRSDLSNLFRMSQLEVPWRQVRNLQAISVAAALELLDRYQHLEKSLGASQLSNWYALFCHFAGSGESLAGLFDVLEKTDSTVLSRRELRDALWYLPEPLLATYVIAKASALPLDDAGLLRRWIDVGLKDIKPEARAAFFSVESARSLDLLSELRGQVDLFDCKRVLQLYAEAMGGIRLKLEENEESVVVGDGLHILLPESVSRFDNREQNFAFYKLAILHQVGFHEFGFMVATEQIQRLLLEFENSWLAIRLIKLLEHARIDWQLAHRFPGIAPVMHVVKDEALAHRELDSELELLIQLTLDASISGAIGVRGLEDELIDSFKQALQLIAKPGADIEDLCACFRRCFRLLPKNFVGDEPELVPHRGNFNLEIAFQYAELMELEAAIEMGEGDEMVQLFTQIDPDDAEIEEVKEGEVNPEQSMLVTELDKDELEVEEASDEKADERMSAFNDLLAQMSSQVREDKRYLYDEWDYAIDDYRRRWCTLKEIRSIDEEPQYVAETLSVHRSLAKRVRKQLSMLKPELLRKIKGVTDGDELDLERTVDAVVDRRSGITPAENIYVQRQRKDRDVSTLFLLDMSASTDDRIPDPDAEPVVIDEDDDDFLASYWEKRETEDQGDRIIDLEKQSVILMAEALEELGDAYSVCGFSGYGRDQVEYYLCKDFDEPYDQRAKGRIGGIKPCRSTRMGPAIRHAAKRLVRTESRIKALIIISDGYPQDFDYGQDRNSKEYGVKDTMKALSEARQQGIQTFCLTVDPSGHDYLREMCPDQQYMIIQEIKQLPDELSKVYRSLTG